MLHGPLLGPLVRFALPLAFTAVLQQLFNTADVFVLGQFVGSEAIAAVGNDAPVIAIFVTLFVGISLGANVVIAKCIGAHRLRETMDAVHTAFLLALLLGALLTIVGELLSDWMLAALGVPEEVMAGAERYLRIYMLGMPAIGVYNFVAAIFRSRGNTQTPLIALAVASFFNIALNLLAVEVLDMGIGGVAAATAIANYVAAGLLVRALCAAHGTIHLELGALRLTGIYAREILRIGLPAGVQGMVFCLSNLVIQAAINSLGPTVMAASSAAFLIEINIYCFMMSFGQVVTTFVGQNYGAGQLARCHQVLLAGAKLMCTFTIIVPALACTFAATLVGFVDPHPEVIAVGCERVYFVVGFYFLDGLVELFSGALRGYGCSLPPAVISLVAICGVRIVWVYTAFVAWPAFRVIMYAYPLSWAPTVVLLMLMYRLYRKNLKVVHMLG